MVGILLLVTGPAALIVALTTDMVPDAPGVGTVAVFLVVFFVFQMLTSGTEEIGWRAYLNVKLRRGRSFWDTGWAVGLPWAVWHLPIVVIIFAQQGVAPVQIVGALAGFTMGVIAAAILHAWFYERTESVFLNIFIHRSVRFIPPPSSTPRRAATYGAVQDGRRAPLDVGRLAAGRLRRPRPTHRDTGFPGSPCRRFLSDHDHRYSKDQTAAPPPWSPNSLILVISVRLM